jgi:HSP90 family molecular chaperone
MAEKKEKKEKTAQTYEFQSEIRQLLDILVYSLYKNKEIFLRELISNAADALNKAQYELLTHEDWPDRDQELKIDITLDADKGLLVVEDNGIGMTREELVQNIGTIAHSGTLEYLQKVSEEQKKGQVDLIGRFGVGFYSAFMVAKEIVIQTRSIQPDQPPCRWASTGDTSYVIEAGDRATRGTRIELHLKKDEKEFAQAARVKTVIRHHSKFVPFPIAIDGEKLERQEAIWTQPKSKLADKDYQDFFHYFANTQDDSLTHLHLSSDAPVQFHALLYVPKTSLEMFGVAPSEPGVDLYCKKVLIQKGCKDIVPDYLRFVRGVIDTEDIPLNISRETIQRNVRLEKIRRHVWKKFFEHLENLLEKDRDRYLEIWKTFGRHVHEGVVGDYEHREKLANLLLYPSSRTGEGEWVSLKEYVARMKPEQKEIYYLSGTDPKAIALSPALELFRKREMEVLFLFDPLQELALNHLHEFDGKPFVAAESAKVEGQEPAAEPGKETGGLVGYLKTVYEGRVADVRVSSRLEEWPCILLQAEGAPSVQMEKIFRMVNEGYEFSKRIFEINAGHPLIGAMTRMHGQDPASPLLKSLALQLLDNMLLREGALPDVEGAVKRIQEIMTAATGTPKEG